MVLKLRNTFQYADKHMQTSWKLCLLKSHFINSSYSHDKIQRWAIGEENISDVLDDGIFQIVVTQTVTH